MFRKNVVIHALIICWILSSFTQFLSAQELTGRQIMQKVDVRDDGDEMTGVLTMRLVNKRGQERIRKVRMFRKDYGKDSKTLIFFEEPADVRGTGFLSWNYDTPDKEDDQWLYLPALRKVRRIAASGRGDYFMGTDFTYDDMGDRRVDEDVHTLVKSENLDGYNCYVVGSIPKEKDYMYSKKVTWVRKDIWMSIRVDFYDDEGNLLKRLQLSQIEEIDGILTAKKMVMENLQTNHRTELTFDEVRYNSGIADETFTQRMLKRGL